jgi:endonuclease/exonuclease/phosphatase family metal-dependent hydrolase
MRTGVLVALVLAPAAATAQHAASPFPRPAGTSFRVLSWNVSRSGFVEHREDFRGLVRLGDPDLLILDEVDGTHTPDDLRAALRGIRNPGDTVWHATIGRGGGYQRGAVVSREPVDALAEFELVAYPDTSVEQVLALAPDSLHQRLRRSFAWGVAVHGAAVRVAGRRLVAVSIDLQCCGLPGTWEERRRTVEARLIRAALRRALGAAAPDGAIAAGDLNLVATSFPLAILLGPYDPPHPGLLPAEAYHRDGRDVWTWDGRDTEFPSKPLDFQLYGPGSLQALAAWVLDTEDLTAAERAAFGLEAEASRRVSDHRPVVVDYRWR